MNNLLKCPCCGEPARNIKHKFHGFSDTFGVRCTSCGLETPQFFDTEEEAAAAWNRRIKPPEINIYNKEETYPNCTVQVLTNTVTGAVSVGWWRND